MGKSPSGCLCRQAFSKIVSERGWNPSYRAIPGSVSRTKFSQLVTWGTCGHDFSQSFWQMILVAGPRQKWVCSQGLRKGGHFCICRWDHYWQTCHSGVSLPFQKTPLGSWAPSEFYNLLSESQNSYKSTFVGGLQYSCCWEGIQPTILLSSLP